MRKVNTVEDSAKGVTLIKFLLLFYMEKKAMDISYETHT